MSNLSYWKDEIASIQRCVDNIQQRLDSRLPDEDIYLEYETAIECELKSILKYVSNLL